MPSQVVILSIRSRPKVAIITTTINSPDFIRHFVKELDDRTVMIVVGDKKTDDRQWSGIDCVEYWSLDRQEGYLDRLVLDESIRNRLFPVSDPLRRNFGYLRAIELGSDVIITVDDDNLPIDCSLVDEHLEALSGNGVIYYSGSIIDPCHFLITDHPVYSRGFPTERTLESVDWIRRNRPDKRILLNMGLWTGKPDVDAVYNVMYPDLESRGYIPDHNIAVSEGTYFPVNTQNTAITGDARLVFHNVYMGMVGSSRLHRYDDIWGGLFTMKLINRLGYASSFGRPIVYHNRNSHRYDKDLSLEWYGVLLNSRMWNIVDSIELSSKDFISCYIELSYGIERACNRYRLDSSTSRFLYTLTDCMRSWVDLVEEIL